MKNEFFALTVALVIGSTVPGGAQNAQNTLREPAGPSASEGGPSPREGQALPAIPLAAPRPPQGPTPGQPWDIERPVVPPTSFIESLRGNDAAINIIRGQGRLLTLRADMASRNGAGAIAVGDPSILEFQVLPNPRMIRLLGRREGITDLSITTADGQTCSFEVHVLFDLDMLRAHLRQAFPDASLQVGQLRDHLVIEGEARSTAQVGEILTMVEAFVVTVENEQAQNLHQTPAIIPAPPASALGQGPPGGATPNGIPGTMLTPNKDNQGGQGGDQGGQGKFTVRIINLIRVPGVRQVLLKVRVAELNRTATREIGADILGVNPATGSIFGTNIAGSTVTASGVLGLTGLTAQGSHAIGPNQTAFGIFPAGDFSILVRALRENQLLSILAEPNLIAMDGHRASFLAGGQFPVPVPQGAGGITNNVTVEFKDFGVQLNFIPYVLEDGKIRLSVTPEVSTIDYALGTVLVQGGTPVPGLDTRRATTTVEMGQGQTLAIAGLMQVELDADTARIPGLGDIPIIGVMFSNTSHKRTEKELVVMVTPYLVNPMNPCQVPATPGSEVTDPTDLEFFLLNRIENRNGREYRATLGWDNPWNVARQVKVQRDCGAGPVGFSQ